MASVLPPELYHPGYVALLGMQLLDVKRPASPAAGAEIAPIVVPGGTVWEIVSVQFRLTTDANVAVRRVRLVASDGTGEYVRFTTTTTQAASLVFTYNWIAGIGRDGSDANDSIDSSLPAPFYLKGGWSLTTDTNNRQVTDQYDRIRIAVREWSEAGIIQQLESLEMDFLSASVTRE